jgi:hypothetical protein
VTNLVNKVKHIPAIDVDMHQNIIGFVRPDDYSVCSQDSGQQMAETNAAGTGHGKYTQ